MKLDQAKQSGQVARENAAIADGPFDKLMHLTAQAFRRCSS